MYRSARRKFTPSESHTSRLHGIERLECRALLSAAPTVLAVSVASTSWSPDFVDFVDNPALEIKGYTIPVGSSAQSASLTWNNLDQISIEFSEDVYIDEADLSISGINVLAYDFSDFHYDPRACLATWTLSNDIDKDRLRLDLDANGINPIRDLDLNILDGDWTNNVSTVSGNGTAGGDFEFNLNVLPTDVNNTANVTYHDYVHIRQLDGKSTTSPGYIAKRDIDGSGTINSTDWQEALDRASEALPNGSPAGSNNDAPTTSGLDLVEVSNAAIDVAISLLSDFSDRESGSSGLTYSILSNSNPAIFDAFSIDQGAKQLVVNATNGASGRASILVRATDSTGLFVDTTVTVDVNRQNHAPIISNFAIRSAGAWSYIVSGDVSDPDDDVSDFIVKFWNVFDIRSCVDETGHFEFAIDLTENDSGWEYATTFDPHVVQSNIASDDVGLT
jgi:hypothetical protein